MGHEGAKVRVIGPLVAAALAGCSGHPASARGAEGSGGGTGSAITGGAGGASGSGGGGSPSASGATSGSGSAGTSATGGAGGASTGAGSMKLISRGLPAFASSGTAANANDDKPNIAWSSEGLPAWLAYDVSSVAAAERQRMLLAWYCYFADYMVAEAKPEQMLPLDYVVEINGAASAASPPDAGWTEVAQVTANSRSARQHVFDLGGANWVRLSISKSSDAAKVMVDADLYSAPAGGSDRAAAARRRRRTHSPDRSSRRRG